ncbi:hypothetical protein O181_059899, partial [Austropuccinia psidii MF-1]|nr:hypothetical protein [Austropuccinia psidii MF-1]
EALSQSQVLKEAFTTAPILSPFNPSLPTIVETDSSDYALGAVLNQELLGIVWALKCWRAFLLSLANSFEVLTDPSSLQYFMSSKVHTCPQAHWAEFHFTITCHPDRLATLPDALSCWDDMYPEKGVDFIRKNPQNFHQIIKQDGIQESRFF